MNLPNALTVGRIFLVPLLVVVLLTKFEGRLILGVRKELVGAAIFGIASLTDVLDGYLARRRQQITTLGQLMDPLADKLLITAAIIMSVLLLSSSIVTATLIDPAQLGQGGAAQGRALAYLAHNSGDIQVCPLFGEVFGTIYDLATVLIHKCIASECLIQRLPHSPLIYQKTDQGT